MNKIGAYLVLLASLLSLVACSGGATEILPGSPDNGTLPEPTSLERTVRADTEAPAATGTARVVPTSIGPEDSLLRVKLGGLEAKSVPILNGGVVDFGDGLKAELFVDPYPTDTLTSWVDLYLTEGESGEPVDDAHVLMEYDMWSMAHGPYVGFSDSAADGHYVFRLDYIMFGAWEQVLEIRKRNSDDFHRLVLMIVAFP